MKNIVELTTIRRYRYLSADRRGIHAEENTKYDNYNRSWMSVVYNLVCGSWRLRRRRRQDINKNAVLIWSCETGRDRRTNGPANGVQCVMQFSRGQGRIKLFSSSTLSKHTLTTAIQA